MKIIPPPPLDPRRHALFLDFDGSIVDFAPTPDTIVLMPGTIGLLENVSRRLGGALAVVTGRRIADVDRHLAPLLLPASGVHGREFRPRPGYERDDPIPTAIEQARSCLKAALRTNDPIMLEDKGSSLVLHFRMHPEERERARSLADDAVRGLDTLHVMSGHAIFEILQRGITKGRAIRRFMRRPPFAGRIPVFVGDDATDEDGMRAAAAEGGFGVKIGPEETAAAYRLPDTEAVHKWLSRLTKSNLPAGNLQSAGPLGSEALS
jgi:trehalose 6-phosphate phosphatase